MSLPETWSARGARLVTPFAVALFVACVWLNQSVGESGWGAYVEGVTHDPSHHILDVARYRFAVLYKRASDVRLYYELANLMLGRPADTAFVTEERGDLPARFTLPYPPADGRWHAPYAEVMLEYPVAAVPFIVAPRLLVSSERAYGYVSGAMMGLALVAAIAVALLAARAAGEGDEGLRRRAWLGSGLMLAQGGIAVQRLDAATALFLALAVWSAVRRKPLAFGAWAGVAAASKLVPILMLPALFAADLSFWRDARRLARFAIAFATAIAVGIGPMFLLSGRALGDVLAYHAARGLNCESTLGFLLAVWRLVTGTRVPTTLSFGSYNLSGSGADVLAFVCGPLSVAATLAVAWVLVRRAHRDGPGVRALPVACAAFAALLMLWLTGKVFSTQYMTWGIPVVLAIPGRLGVRLAWRLVAAMALTQFYVIGHHELVMQGTALGLLNFGARQAFLVAAAYLAVKSLAAEPSPALAEAEAS